MSSPLLGTASLLAAAAVCLQGCDAAPRYRAAEGVRAFLAAVQKDDRAAFEAHVDRARLTSDVRRQLEASSVLEGLGLGGMNGAVGGQMAAALTSRMISPESFRVVWMRSGVSIRRAPSALEILPMLRMMGDDSACLRNPRGGRCILTFANEGGTWKLVGVRADIAEDERPAYA